MFVTAELICLTNSIVSGSRSLANLKFVEFWMKLVMFVMLETSESFSDSLISISSVTRADLKCSSRIFLSKTTQVLFLRLVLMAETFMRT